MLCLPRLQEQIHEERIIDIHTIEWVTSVTENNTWLQRGRNLVVAMKWPVCPLAEVSVKWYFSSERWMRGCSRSCAGSATLTDSRLLTPAQA